MDGDLANDLREKGLSRSREFSWDKTARETLAVIESVHGDARYRRTRMEVGNDERGMLSGWHARESGDGHCYRWTAREGRLRLFSAGSWLAVDAATSVPNGQQRLSVRVNGMMVGTTELVQAWKTFRFPVDALVRDRPVEVVLRVNFCLPASVKGSDPRELGVRVSRAAFEP